MLLRFEGLANLVFVAMVVLLPPREAMAQTIADVVMVDVTAVDVTGVDVVAADAVVDVNTSDAGAPGTRSAVGGGVLEAMVVVAPRATTQAPVATTPRLSGRWFGWQTLIADGSLQLINVISVSAYSAGARTAGSLAFAGTADIGLILSGPIVQWSHGNIVRGFLSLLLHGGLSVVGVVVGAQFGAVFARCPPAGFCIPIDGIISGMGAGLVVFNTIATAIDVGLMTYETDPLADWTPAAVPVTTPVPTSPPQIVYPTFAVAPNQLTFGLMGSF